MRLKSRFRVYCQNSKGENQHLYTDKINEALVLLHRSPKYSSLHHEKTGLDIAIKGGETHIQLWTWFGTKCDRHKTPNSCEDTCYLEDRRHVWTWKICSM